MVLEDCYLYSSCAHEQRRENQNQCYRRTNRFDMTQHIIAMPCLASPRHTFAQLNTRGWLCLPHTLQETCQFLLASSNFCRLQKMSTIIINFPSAMDQLNKVNVKICPPFQKPTKVSLLQTLTTLVQSMCLFICCAHRHHPCSQAPLPYSSALLAILMIIGFYSASAQRLIVALHQEYSRYHIFHGEAIVQR